nr:MAG TPA: hypothetical protein [Caudoviricetes sp.]
MSRSHYKSVPKSLQKCALLACKQLIISYYFVS